MSKNKRKGSDGSKWATASDEDDDAAAAPAPKPQQAKKAKSSATSAASTSASSVESSAKGPLVPYGAAPKPAAASAGPALPPGLAFSAEAAAAAGMAVASQAYRSRGGAGYEAAGGAFDESRPLNSEISAVAAAGAAATAAAGLAGAGADAGGSGGGGGGGGGADGKDKGGKEKKKWARKQVDKPPPKLQRAEGQNEFNIWYGKYLGDKPDREKEKAATRCIIWKDAGLTMADVRGGQAPFCIFFARGCCMHGSNCHHLHRLPDQRDYGRIDMMHDIFGREKHATDREDMDGVGCFNREGRTLWVTNFNISQNNIREIIARHFGEWGTIDDIAIKPKHRCAFVRYLNRCNAEFAKVAMAEQSLDGSEQLTVKWANDDPNPGAIKRIQRDYERKAVRAMEAKGVGATDAPFHLPPGVAPPPAAYPLSEYMALYDKSKDNIDPTKPGAAAYPNTDGQYGAAGGAIGPATRPSAAALAAAAKQKEAAEKAAAQAEALSADPKLFDAYSSAATAVRSGDRSALLDAPPGLKAPPGVDAGAAAAAAAAAGPALPPGMSYDPYAAAAYASHYAAALVQLGADGKWSYGNAAGAPAAAAAAAPMGKEAAENAASMDALLDRIAAGKPAE